MTVLRLEKRREFLIMSEERVWRSFLVRVVGVRCLVGFWAGLSVCLR